jgi:hypothetical protein
VDGSSTGKTESGESDAGDPESAESELEELREEEPEAAESGHRSVSGGELNAELPSDDHNLARAITSAHQPEPHGISSAPKEGEGPRPRVSATPTLSIESKL